LDRRSQEVIAYHLALERAVDTALALTLPRAERLRGLGFGQKVSVLQATSESLWIDLLAAAVLSFNDLRNMVAHGDGKNVIDKGVTNVCASVEAFTGVRPSIKKATIGGLAMAICDALSVDAEARARQSD